MPNPNQPTRRAFLKAAGATSVAGAALSLTACAGSTSKARGHVVVVGGGYGGATVAKYLRLWSNRGIDVTLVERNASFISCPLSNLVVAGYTNLADITVAYANLKQHWGVRVIRDEVTGVDTARRSVSLAQGGTLSYDRLVLSPGVDFQWDQVPALNNAAAQAKILHAWKVGPQTMALRKQLEDMKDGGVFAITVPKAPYRCPPGPYERACLVADYLKAHKPRSKVLILDANPEVTSKKALFTQAWEELYPGIVDYRPNSQLTDVDVAGKTALLASGKVKADVLNVIPPQQAGAIAVQAGLKLIDNRWVDIDWLTLESTNAPGVHVLGDAIFPAPTMPKSGHMANQHAKVAAAAIVNLQAGLEPNSEPLLNNTCYSFVGAHSAIHITAVHRYDAAQRQPLPVAGAGGVSAMRSEAEAHYAQAWAKNIWADMLT